MIPVLTIPILNRGDLLLRCIQSIDRPVEHLVIVCNGDPAIIDPIREAEIPPHVEIIQHRNAGVAGSWNEVIKLYPAPWWMLVGNDIQFTPGDLDKLEHAAWSEHTQRSALFGNHGHSLCVITQRGIQNVGLFDENIYPAYLEDSDWMWRLHLAGESYADVPGVSAIHGENGQGSCTVHSDPYLNRRNIETHAANFRYYRKKWGGDGGSEKFKTPFNLPGMPVDYWKFEPIIRQLNQWNHEH